MFKKIFTMFLAVTLLSLTVLTPVANAGSQPNDKFGIPDKILGFPVLFLQTPQNTVAFPESYKGIAILGTKVPFSPEHVRKIPIKEILNALPPGWTVQFAYGVNRTTESLAKANERNNESKRALIAATGHLPKLGTEPGRAIMQNTDPASYDLVYQNVNCYAPTVGSSQDGYSAFLNNVETDYGFFMQVGLLFIAGYGKVVYTNDNFGLEAQDFSISYVAGHQYSFAIQYSGTSGTWYQIAADITAQDADLFTATNASGTKLYNFEHTSAWFENYNANSNWYSGFNSTLTAFYAKESTEIEQPENNLQNWGGTSIIVRDSNNQIITNNVITGNLANGGSANWSLSNMPLH